MSELGSGSGTSYPASLDVDNSVEVDSSTTARADVPNDLAAAIIAVQGELGTDPAGSAATVKARLAVEHNNSGTHSSITALNLTLSGELIQKVGSDVSSASDLDVTGVGNFFDVTGTTQINTIKSKGVGTQISLQFDGAVVLAHDATNLDLGAAGINITTTAGDVYTFYEYASADWRLIGRSGSAVVPSGVIVIWSGAISAIPSGWVICDGNNSTPNFTDRFVIHASSDSGATYDVGDTGGSLTTGTSTLSTSQLAAHTHTFDKTTGSKSTVDDNGTAVMLAATSASATSSTGSGATHTHSSTIVPYYALAYIMKS
jgi:microcystin-dependent protein